MRRPPSLEGLTGGNQANTSPFASLEKESLRSESAQRGDKTLERFTVDSHTDSSFT